MEGAAHAQKIGRAKDSLKKSRFGVRLFFFGKASSGPKN
jgi:hypothetical protein